MLVLMRKLDEDVIIEVNGERIVVRVVGVDATARRVRLGFEANPETVRIMRDEARAKTGGKEGKHGTACGYLPGQG